MSNKLSTIACKSGNIFSACSEEEANKISHLIEIGYYTLQECIVKWVPAEEFCFTPCDCDHCKTLKHEAYLIEKEDE